MIRGLRCAVKCGLRVDPLVFTPLFFGPSLGFGSVVWLIAWVREEAGGLIVAPESIIYQRLAGGVFHGMSENRLHTAVGTTFEDMGSIDLDSAAIFGPIHRKGEECSIDFWYDEDHPRRVVGEF